MSRPVPPTNDPGAFGVALLKAWGKLERERACGASKKPAPIFSGLQSNADQIIRHMDGLSAASTAPERYTAYDLAERLRRFEQLELNRGRQSAMIAEREARLANRIADEISRLGEDVDKVVRLYYVDERTQTEIAAAVGKSQPTVQRGLARAEEMIGRRFPPKSVAESQALG